jgi:hypothetical protein
MDSKYIGFTNEEIREDFRKLMVAAAPQTMLYAMFFAERQRDFRLMEKIYDQVQYTVEKYQMTPLTIMKDLDMGLENNYFNDQNVMNEVYEEAMSQLESENV